MPCSLDTEKFLSLYILLQEQLFNTNISDCENALNKLVTEMEKSSLLLIIIVFILLYASEVESHRRRDRKKPTPRPKHKKPKHCKKLAHCEVNSWSVWSKCSLACGTKATQWRARKVSHY